MSAYSKIALALVLANALIAPVGQTAFAQNSEASEKTNWIAKGGELSISFNTELLRELGLTAQEPNPAMVAPKACAERDLEPALA